MRELQNKKRDFKGIWIPADIWLNTELTLIEKIIFIEIDSLDGTNGCYANNQHFADFCNISKSRVSQIINQLKKKGYISVDIIRDKNKQVINRTIRSLRVYQLTTVSSETKEGVSSETKEGVSLETKEGYVENCEYKNTSFKNTLSINNNSQAEARQNIPFKEIIEYLNDRTSKKYNFKAKTNRNLIKARFNEGYTKEQFITVIDNKVKEWKDTDMDKYLRPQTLFGNKFDVYLNQEVENNGRTNNSNRKSEETFSEKLIAAGFKPNEHELENIDF